MPGRLLACLSWSLRTHAPLGSCTRHVLAVCSVHIFGLLLLSIPSLSTSPNGLASLARDFPDRDAQMEGERGGKGRKAITMEIEDGVRESRRQWL